MDKIFKEELQKYVARNPQDIPDIIDAVKEGLNAFVERQRRSREILATNALRAIMGLQGNPRKRLPRFLKDKAIPWLIDAAFHQFRSGTAHASPAEQEWFEGFLEIARREEVDAAWLREVKGWDYAVWWREVVEPRLTQEVEK